MGTRTLYSGALPDKYWPWTVSTAGYFRHEVLALRARPQATACRSAKIHFNSFNLQAPQCLSAGFSSFGAGLGERGGNQGPSSSEQATGRHWLAQA